MRKQPVALLVNDIHAGSENLNEFNDNWNEMIDVANKNKIKDIYIGGDLWQARSSQSLETLMFVKNSIKRATDAGLTLFIAEGNHCKVDQEQLVGYSSLFSDMKNVHVIDEYEMFEYGDEEYPTILCIMSYFPEDGSFIRRLGELRKDLTDAYKGLEYQPILYIHEGISGALSKPNKKELPVKIFKDFTKVLVGHYHDRIKVEPNIQYIGASRQHSFGEDEEKGYTILYDNGDTEFVKNEANTRYKTIVAKPSEISDGLLNEIDSNYKVKLKVMCSESEAAELNRDDILKMGFSKVEVSANVEVSESDSIDVTEKLDKDSIKCEYEKFCDKNDYKKELGLKYLE